MLTAPLAPFTLFARRLRAARKLLGVSQMELGVRAGIDESSASARINQYERGKHMPDFLTVCNLAKVLEVPTAYFYTEEEHLAELIMISGRLQTSDHKTLLDLATNLLNEFGIEQMQNPPTNSGGFAIADSGKEPVRSQAFAVKPFDKLERTHPHEGVRPETQ
ncbi:MAG TPA: helix-turn-helix domain-containing protein [Gallionella sp.]|nr:helix-turn-helix domain-containing protein [Gallionella sp.]